MTGKVEDTQAGTALDGTDKENEPQGGTDAGAANEDQTQDQEDGQESGPDTVEYWRTRSRQNEARARRNAEKAKQWDEYQKSKPADNDKTTGQAEELAGVKARAEKAEAALKYGLSLEDLALLGDGGDFDKRAAALAKRIGAGVVPRDPALGRENNPAKTKDFVRDALVNGW